MDQTEDNAMNHFLDDRPSQDVAAPVAALVPQAPEGQLGDGRGVLRDRAGGELITHLIR